MTTTQDFGTYGVWRGVNGIDDAFAQATERLGFGALWVGGSPSGDLEAVERILDATETLTVATGIVNIWKDAATDVAASFRRIKKRHPGRFVLGIGSGHREATPERVKPLSAMREYVSVLETKGLQKEQMLLAALGDKTLAFSAERTLGAHPYLTVPAHTAHARTVLGDALLAPELKVVRERRRPRRGPRDRAQLPQGYFGLRNYVGALVRFGIDPDDIASGGSDAVIDKVAANPTAAAAVAGAREHLDAGADHVSLQVLEQGPDRVARADRGGDRALTAAGIVSLTGADRRFRDDRAVDSAPRACGA